ncbi:DASH complex subunit Ask1-domain-containing protein [Lipomyces tetrasporus]|uniref:DASH complex subunit ASK1 n=1 Tax=Lipomyces tetrasporus TaxID=54092 RepID=A0AAD7VP98_9ASCO|nr:DASH complex subunit Ask1-domain-containing protein [Lipomyces tetrasporus]KAJ8096848.1 DASH complex subunit Ask1-domain-containing protein [Lipomyces tetrasporus]
MDRKPTMSASASRIKNGAPRQSIAYTRASVIGLPSQMPTHAATTASLRAPPAGSSATPVATAAPRTLTEELEKIEQSITLTLQEIDQNFSTSHRIITSSILPIVEEYALQSQAVWQSSKFWKEFFESSANVSLAGYEELNAEEETVNDVDQSQATEYSATMDYDYSHAGMQTPREAAKSAQESQQADASIGVTDDMDDSSFVTYVNNKYSNVKSKREESRQQAFPLSKYEDVEDDIETERSIAGTAQFMKSLNLDDQSTPRVVLGDRSDILNGIDERQTTKSQPHTMQWADMVSPFEEMRSELKARHIGSFESSTSISLPQGLQNNYDRDDQSLEPPLPTTQIQSSSFTEPRTPGRQHLYRRPENSTIDEESASILRTPESSPFSPFVGANRPRSYGGQQSVLLHRVLDKKWGIQVTPKGPSPSKRAQLARHGRQASAMATPKNAPISYASRFSSSPLDSPPVPHINSTIFSSPERS